MAGIFDVFTILFKSETEEATEGVKKLDGAVDQLDVSVAEADKGMADLGQAAEEAAASQNTFLSMAQSVAGLAAAWISLSGIVSNFNAAVGMADQLGEFTASIDGNIEELSAWGDAIKMNGGDMSSFQGTIASLSADFTNLAVKGKSRVKPFFDELGISMLDANGKARNVMEVLPEIAQAFEGLSKQESLALGKKMGLDGGTVRALQGGKKELDELLTKMRRLGVITKQQSEASEDFNDNLDLTAHGFRSLYLAVAEKVLPILTSFLQGVQEVTIFLREHSGFAIGFFGTVAAVITAVYLPAIFKAIAATGLLSAPFLLVIGAVALLAAGIGLLYDDFKTWTEGGKSLIGELIGDFEKFKPLIKGFGIIFDEVKERIFAMWRALLNPIETLQALKTSLIDALSPVKDMLPSFEDIKAGAKIAFENINTPLAGMTSAAIGAAGISNNNTVTVGKVEVNTQATDAEGISRDIGAKLGKELRQASANFDDGVAY